jgi:hypothetical protein
MQPNGFDTGGQCGVSGQCADWSSHPPTPAVKQPNTCDTGLHGALGVRHGWCADGHGGCVVGRQIQLWHGTKSLGGQNGEGGQIQLLLWHGTKSLGGQNGEGGQIQLLQATKSLRGFPPGATCAPTPAAGAAAPK